MTHHHQLIDMKQTLENLERASDRPNLTKIVCTIGPASGKPEVLSELIKAGMNVARINMSHGTQQGNAKYIDMIREEAKKLGKEVGILCDLQGPKIRCNTFNGGFITLQKGERVLFKGSSEPGKPGLVTTRFLPLIKNAKVGDRILMDDGLLEVEVVEKQPDALVCQVILGGKLKNNKGINLPTTQLDINALTEKDLSDLQFCLGLDIDFVALSFVRNANDVRLLRKYITTAQKDVKIVVKIEKPEALKNLDEILRVTDIVMVARGDLGVEVGVTKTPTLQKQIIQTCLAHGVPVITATQMLESMITNPRPTRAESSDVANAVFDGTDAVMLSAETASGAYPVETVLTMRQIVRDAECSPFFFNFERHRVSHSLASYGSKLGMSVGKAAHLLANGNKAAALASWTETGRGAMRLVSRRPSVPVYGLTRSRSVVRRLSVMRGAFGILVPEQSVTGRNVYDVMECELRARGLAKAGQSVVMTASLPDLNGTTNSLHVRLIGRSRL